MYKDFSKERFVESTLEVIKCGLETQVSGDVLRSLELDAQIAHNLHNVIALQLNFLAPGAIKNSADFKEFPETWWDGFKLAKFPKWLLKRFPAKMQRVRVYSTTTKLCPHLPFDPQKAHVRFVTSEDK